MATRQTLDAMIAAVGANTNATQAAKDALEHFATSQAELTQQLSDAIANSEAADDTEVAAAVAAIQANNATLTAAIPQVAEAVTQNTDASPPPG